MLNLLRSLFSPFAFTKALLSIGCSFVVGDEPPAPGSGDEPPAPGDDPAPGDEPPAPGAGDPPAPGNDDPVDPDYNWEQELEDKGPQNVMMEKHRMGKKIGKLEKEIADLRAKMGQPDPNKPPQDPGAPKPGEPKPGEPKPGDQPPAGGQGGQQFDTVKYIEQHPRGKAALETLRKKVDQETIDAFIDLAGVLATDIASSTVEPYAADKQEQEFKGALAKFSADAKYKFGMSKVGKLVEDKIRKEFRREYWKDEHLIKSVYGQVIADHPELFTGGGRREIIDEPGAGPSAIGGDGSAAGSGTSDAELARFAAENGMTMKTEDEKRTVREAYAAYKTATGQAK